MFNSFILNPAVAGTADHFDFRAGYRAQWLNIPGSPRTFYASAHGHLGQHIGPYKGRHINEPKQHHGVGAIVLADVTGPISRTSAYVSYAFNMKMAKDFRLSIGSFLGMQQFTLDGEKITLPDQTSAITGGARQMVPDGTLGLWGYGKNYYVGASMQQIFGNNLSLGDAAAGVNLSKLYRHAFVTAGYKFQVSDDIAIIPSFLMKQVSPVPLSFDLNTKVRYKDMIWLGVSYRTQGDIVTLIGVNWKNMIEVGYSFDYITSDLTNYSGGSHEIMVAYKLTPRGKATSPSDFW